MTAFVNLAEPGGLMSCKRCVLGAAEQGTHLGMGQNRGPQVLVYVATYQGSILGTYF